MPIQKHMTSASWGEAWSTDGVSVGSVNLNFIIRGGHNTDSLEVGGERTGVLDSFITEAKDAATTSFRPVLAF